MLDSEIRQGWYGSDQAALADLQADTELVAAVGEDLVGNLVVIKEDEIEKTSALKQQALRDFYIFYI